MYQELLSRSANFMKQKGGKTLKINPADLIPSNDGWDKDRARIKQIAKTYDQKAIKLDSW